MGKTIKIKQGLNIRLQGEADKVIITPELSKTFAIKPPDFFSIKPKLLVGIGDEVKAGTPVMFDKNNEKAMICSPVSGEVVEIVRGERRKILEIKIIADSEISYTPFKTTNFVDYSREEIIDVMLKSGVWPLIRQRPFSIVARPDTSPKAIFVSAFDSNPLGPDNDFAIHGQEKEFQAGLDVLSKLTDGKVHLNVHDKKSKSNIFQNAKNVQINTFRGPHPSGNVGVQIHHIDPINKGDIVWYSHPQDVVIIGRLFLEGRFNAQKIIALTGSEVKKRRYYKALPGTHISSIIEKNNLIEGGKRFISGNVLTGTKIGPDGYLGFYDTQITVLPENHDPEFFGWLKPGFDKFSISKTFWSWATPNKKFKLNTKRNGEKRAFVVTGEYEKVFPMDIYPVQLLKSILTNDIELMEKLGIYEVDPEDFALCEFVCTSKINSQEIMKEGVELMLKETM